jgi:hypothetical protein
MHPLDPLLDARLTNTNAPDFDSIVRMILSMEDVLIREKVLSSDFVFVICRCKERGALSKPATGAPFVTREGRFAGYIDVFDQRSIAGWAADAKAFSAPLTVDVYVDDRLQGTLTADVFRQDLKDAGYGDGRKGFTLALASPRSLPPGRIARLLVSGSKQVLATCLSEARSQTGN